jgi:arabinofuranosyltransferase
MTSSEPRALHLLLWGAVLCGFALHLSHWFLPADDAFITYRHVDNLLGGHGLVFNPGEPVEGYSNLLWALLLAGLGGLGLPLPVAGSLLAAVCGGLCVAAVARSSEVLGVEGPLRLLPAACLAAASPWAYWSGAGLETTGFGLGLVLLWWGYHRDASPVALLVGVALLEWLRPEGLAAAPVLLLGLWFDRRADRTRIAQGVVGFAVLWGGRLIARKLYYGAWVATPTVAKAVHGVEHVGRGVDYIARGVAENGLVPLVLIAGLALALSFRRALEAPDAAGSPDTDADPASPSALRWRPLRPTWTLAAGIAGYSLFVMQVGGDSLYRHRLLAHVLPLLCLLAGGVLAPFWGGARAGVLLAVAALSMAWPALSHAPFYRGHPLTTAAAMEEGWSALGRTLHAHAPADLVVATSAAGRMPFESKRRTIDLLGLCDPAIARSTAVSAGGALAAGHERADPKGVFARRPDLIHLSMLDALTLEQIATPSADRWILERGDLRGYASWFDDPAFLAAYRPALLTDGAQTFAVLLLRGGRGEQIPASHMRVGSW